MSESNTALVEYLARHRGGKDEARALLLRASIDIASFELDGVPLDLWAKVVDELLYVRAPGDWTRFLAQVRRELPRAPVWRDGLEDTTSAVGPSVEPSKAEAKAKAEVKPASASRPSAKAEAEAEEPAAAGSNKEPSDRGDPSLPRELISGTAGVVLTLVSIAIQITVSCLPASADLSLKILVALGAGFIGGAITGRVRVAVVPTEGQPSGLLAGWKVEAVGGIAVSLLVGAVLFYRSSPDPRCEQRPSKGETRGEPDERVAPLLPPDSKPEPESEPVKRHPPQGMRLVSGGTLLRGSSEAEWRGAYQACRELEREGWESEDCSEDTWAREQRVHGQTPIGPLFLDINEVSVRQLGTWLRERVGRGELLAEGQAVLDEGKVIALLGVPAALGRPAITQWQLDAEGQLEIAPGRGGFPAALVSWRLADAYCRDRGARLPSEVEWEWAARGAEHASRPWSGARSCTRIVFDRMPGGECSDQAHGPAQVGAGLGDESWAKIRDLGGSVSEWVADEYVDETSARAGVDRCVRAVEVDEHQAGVRTCHLFKGGSWAWPALFARAAGRSVGDSAATTPAQLDTRQILFDDVGFRCAQSVKTRQRTTSRL